MTKLAAFIAALAKFTNQGLLWIARALQIISYFVCVLATLRLVALPFIAPSFLSWLGDSGVAVGIMVAAYLILFRTLPMLLRLCAWAILTKDQKVFLTQLDRALTGATLESMGARVSTFIEDQRR